MDGNKLQTTRINILIRTKQMQFIIQDGLKNFIDFEEFKDMLLEIHLHVTSPDYLHTIM